MTIDANLLTGFSWGMSLGLIVGIVLGVVIAIWQLPGSWK